MGGLRLALALSFFFLEDAWMIVLQLPEDRQYFVWEGTPGTDQDWSGLAEGGKFIL